MSEDYETQEMRPDTHARPARASDAIAKELRFIGRLAAELETLTPPVRTRVLTYLRGLFE